MINNLMIELIIRKCSNITSFLILDSACQVCWHNSKTKLRTATLRTISRIFKITLETTSANSIANSVPQLRCKIRDIVCRENRNYSFGKFATKNFKARISLYRRCWSTEWAWSRTELGKNAKAWKTVNSDIQILL